MLTQQDLKQLAQKGIAEQQIETQLGQFKTGFPFLKLEAAAAIGRGIVAPNDAERKHFVDAWQKYKAEGKKVVKFVPASGAASRMFKDMFAFVDADYDVPTTDFEKKYFDNIDKFAFSAELDAVCQKNNGKGIRALIAEGNYKAVAANMLKAEGLNYGHMYILPYLTSTWNFSSRRLPRRPTCMLRSLASIMISVSLSRNPAQIQLLLILMEHRSVTQMVRCCSVPVVMAP